MAGDLPSRPPAVATVADADADADVAMTAAKATTATVVTAADADADDGDVEAPFGDASAVILRLLLPFLLRLTAGTA